MKMKNGLILCSMISVSLVGCNSSIEDSTSSNSSDLSISESESEQVSSSNSSELVSSPSESEQVSTSISAFDDVTYEVNENFDFEGYGYGEPNVKQMSKLDSYTPKTIDTSTYETTTTKLGEGVDLIQVTYNLAGVTTGATVKPYCVVVDLNKANIVAGSYDNTTTSSFSNKSVPYAQALAWARDNPTKQVLAVTNADFFGATSVNAFVKDGVVLKAAHNYDLGDVPESKPMLFGVSSKGAQIAPMTNYSSYNTNLTASLKSKAIVVFGEDGTPKTNYSFVENSALSEGIGLISAVQSKKNIRPNSVVYLFKRIQNDTAPEGEIRGCIVKKMRNVSSVLIENDTYGYISVAQKVDAKFEIGDYFTALTNTVVSDDGLWNHYDTILGCRHSLVEAGAIPETVANETSNGAKSRVPRTAVGIMDDGKVVIVSVEDLHYGKKADICTGLNLSQLADFMRYFGCYDAANFDGGGSSQLITRINDKDVVQTRSSDTGSSELKNTRSVLNTIIVTTK